MDFDSLADVSEAAVTYQMSLDDLATNVLEAASDYQGAVTARAKTREGCAHYYGLSYLDDAIAHTTSKFKHALSNYVQAVIAEALKPKE